MQVDVKVGRTGEIFRYMHLDSGLQDLSPDLLVIKFPKISASAIVVNSRVYEKIHEDMNVILAMNYHPKK